MKRSIKKAMKPQKSFEAWADENNIDLSKPKQPLRKKLFMNWVSIAASLILIVAVMLPFAFPKGESQPLTQNKIYSAQDIISQNITLEELYAIDNLLLFDKKQIMQNEKISKDVPKEDVTIILSYSLLNCLFAASDQVNAFSVNYKIRFYKNYEFYGVSKYAALEFDFFINDIKISYSITDEGRNDLVSLLKFSQNELEYFLEVKGYEGVTEITEETLKILLTDLLNS